MDPFDLRDWPAFTTAGGDACSPAVIYQVAIDSQRIEGRSSLFVALPGKNTDGHRFVADACQRGAKFALVRKDYQKKDLLPGMTLLKVDDTLQALQCLAGLYRQKFTGKIIAITGSYGKTMAKDLLYKLLKKRFTCSASPESFNSQLGVALSLFTIKQNDQLAIIEAAISQAGEMDHLNAMLDPDYAILTQVSQKHLDSTGLENLSKEFIKLFCNGRLNWVILPMVDYLLPYLSSIDAEIFHWNIHSSNLPHASPINDQTAPSIPFQLVFPEGTIYKGTVTSGFQYYMDLINIAVRAAWKLGVAADPICNVLQNHVLEPSRKEIWKSPHGVTFLNDTYSQDPQSVEEALRFLDQIAEKGRKVFLFGGFKGAQLAGSYRSAANMIAKYRVDHICLFGDHPFEPLQEALKSSGVTPFTKAATFNEALTLLKSSMQVDDTVLIKGDKKESLEQLTEEFHESPCSNLCLINLAAIEHNIKVLRARLAPGTRLMVMVKALAYGTDNFRIAKHLESCGVDILGVSYVEEGVELKRKGIQQAIFVLNAAEYEIYKVVKWNLEVGISSENFIELLAEEAKRQDKCIKVHLHIDTGMCRFGCRVENVLTLAHLISQHPSLIFQGVMTHFAAADQPAEDAFTLKQIQTFKNAIQLLETNGFKIPWKHASNSAAALRFELPQFNMVRLGLAIYGLHPSEHTHQVLDLRLAISLMSRIAGINLCQPGDTISYGRTYLVKNKEQKIAILPIGYFDGLHRSYSGCGQVIIRGQKVPMVGRICMDYMMVNVTDVEGAAIGDPVLIFGEDEYGAYLSPEDFARRGNSIIHELITCMGPRIQRIFIHEENIPSKNRSLLLCQPPQKT